jgi:hypothetical protein
MNGKSILAMNVAWAAIAAGAFLLGKGNVDDISALDGSDVRTAARARDGLSALTGSSGAGSGEIEVGGAHAIRNLSPEAAGQRLSDALADQDPIRRKARIAELLLNLNADKVEEIRSAFEEAPKGEETDRHFRDFLYAWARFAGEDAVAYATDPESARRTGWGATTAVSGWAANDPEAAKQYVAGVANVETRQWMHYGVTRELMRTNLDEAISYSEENVKSRARGAQMDQLAGEIVQHRGIEGLIDWVSNIDHTKEENDLLSYKQHAVAIALDRLAADDPSAALQFITENSIEPFLTSDSLERAARRAAGPINEELDWLVKLPGEIAGQQHAIGERFEDYIREDFSAAGEWRASQPLGPAFDEAIQDYARSAARDDREAALAWAERITDPKLREETIKRLAPQVRVETRFIESDQG